MLQRNTGRVACNCYTGKLYIRDKVNFCIIKLCQSPAKKPDCYRLLGSFVT